eukprot:516185_1
MPKHKGNRRKGGGDDAQTRIAVVSGDKCKPNKCRLECKKNCPVNRQGKACVEVKSTSKLSFISEILCIGCNICIKKCPFEAIKILNLPSNLEHETTHRFGPNSFKLHRLPIPRQNQVLGLVGTNGIGKSTALKILTGRTKPNLGQFEDPPGWEEIRKYFRGSELQNYFQRILEEDLETVMKPQYVDHVPKKVKPGATVKKLLKKKDDRNMYKTLLKSLDLKNVQKREVINLSGGELQRFCIAICCCRDVDVYMFDEPSSYLDVKQRLKAAQAIRELISNEEEQRRAHKHGRPKSAYVIVVEHDLAVLDYLSDFVCMLYGAPGAFGVVTMPFSVREGINIFLSGFLPTENMRFRDFELNFKVTDAVEDDEDKEKDKEKEKAKKEKEKKDSKKGRRKTEEIKQNEEEEEVQLRTQDAEYYRLSKGAYRYPTMHKTLGTFNLTIECGWFRDSEIVVMLGENGTGKTTFVKMLAGLMKPDDESQGVPELKVSYKPQKISPTFQHSVQTLLHKRIRGMYMHPQFITDVVKPLKAKELYDKIVTNLSGGELQRVALVLALGSPADVYLIDEPSAYLDSEQRIIAAKVIKRYILHAKKSAFVVEHDFIMATYLADRVIVFEGMPAIKTLARSPQSLLRGMNKFLKQLNITFRRDPNNWRPRINKLNSQKDSEQKKS